MDICIIVLLFTKNKKIINVPGNHSFPNGAATYI